MITGQNGILKQAQNAADLALESEEREYLEENVLLVQMARRQQDASSKKLGAELKPKNVEHSSDWYIVKVNGTTTYDNKANEGWYFIKKETPLPDYGNAKYSWLVNYKTGEIILLEEGKYLDVRGGEMLAVTDHLILNIDSTILEKGVVNDEQILEETLGGTDGNVDLVGFKFESEDSGLTQESFNLDGIDDYIKIKYDEPEEQQILATNGFTFEFTGIWDGGTTDPLIVEEGGDWLGLFCYWNGVEEEQAGMRFGIQNQNYLAWSALGSRQDPNVRSDWSKRTSPWNIYQGLPADFRGREVSFTIVVDATSLRKGDGKTHYQGQSKDYVKSAQDQYIKQAIYIDGAPLCSGDYNKAHWDNFCDNLSSLHYFCLGRSSYRSQWLLELL